MSRRPSKHAPNKAKLTVSKQHDNQCKRLLDAFCEFIDEPWAQDQSILAQLQSASNDQLTVIQYHCYLLVLMLHYLYFYLHSLLH